MSRTENKKVLHETLRAASLPANTLATPIIAAHTEITAISQENMKSTRSDGPFSVKLSSEVETMLIKFYAAGLRIANNYYAEKSIQTAIVFIDVKGNVIKQINVQASPAILHCAQAVARTALNFSTDVTPVLSQDVDVEVARALGYVTLPGGLPVRMSYKGQKRLAFVIGIFIQTSPPLDPDAKETIILDIMSQLSVLAEG